MNPSYYIKSKHSFSQIYFFRFFFHRVSNQTLLTSNCVVVVFFNLSLLFVFFFLFFFVFVCIYVPVVSLHYIVALERKISIRANREVLIQKGILLPESPINLGNVSLFTINFTHCINLAVLFSHRINTHV